MSERNGGRERERVRGISAGVSEGLSSSEPSALSECIPLSHELILSRFNVWFIGIVNTSDMVVAVGISIHINFSRKN